METITGLLGQLGAAGTVAMGLLGLLSPNRASELTGLTATHRTAFAEFRATFGGLFVALGIIPLLHPHPVAFVVSGGAWLGAALGRTISIALDGGHREPRNYGGLLLESLLGGLVLAGAYG
jgi:hypothetical protein